MSSDGSLMVGNALIGDDPSTPDYFEFDLRAFVWTPCGGVRDLGALPNSSFYSVSAVSADGVVVVGSYLSHENYMLHPFVWDRLHGLQDLRTLLVSLGVDLKDWDLGLGAGIGVAKNGREVVITGGGYHSNGTHHTWRVTLTLDRCHRRGCGRN